MWTPPHFWALALVKNDDYTRANIPMLPVVAGAQETRRQIVIYAIMLTPLAIAPSFIGMASIGYGVLASLGGTLFVGLSLQLYKTGITSTRCVCLHIRLFIYSCCF